MPKRIIQHVAFWLSYLLFESYVEFAWISSSFATLSWQQRFLIALSTESLILLVKVPLTYVVIQIVQRFLQKQKNWLLMILSIAASFFLAIAVYRPIVVYFIFPYIYHETSPESLYDLNRCIVAFLDLVFVVGVAFALKQYRYQLKWKQIEKNLVNEKLAAELNFLKAQTNPHFLFNTLNNIYALARKKSDHTADVVMKLSKLLRFMLYESKKDTIPLADEVQVLDNYIELERMRYGDKLDLRFSREIDDERQPIAPLILLPFVENAFKHGASESRFHSYITIELRVKQNLLSFSIRNSKNDEPVNISPEKIGLNNIRRQLELLYPDHTLEIESTHNSFAVSLNLNLHHHATL